jgi:UDP-2,3-diacylglucosamine pyrophosphatase LpxH
MKSRPLFMDQHMQVVSQLIALTNRGTQVIYIPGNHDHEFRAIAGRDICGIPVQVDASLNSLRRLLGQDYFPLSALVKEKIRGAQEYITRFESIAAEYAAWRGYDGIVCGHIHKPAIRDIDGTLYANDGDWVEHRTALAETHEGRLEILGWQNDTVIESSRSAA